MNKGINTVIGETKAELVSLVNSKLEMGVPVSVMEVVVENLLTQLKLHTINAIKMESEITLKEEASEVEKEE